MLKMRKFNRLLSFKFFIVFLLIIIFPTRIWGQAESILEAQKKLEGVTSEEKEILQNLFSLLQEIEEMEREEKKIGLEIESIQNEIGDLETKIINEQKRYETKREALKQVLETYQRGGPGSYLEIILNAENLTMFLRRINVLQDLTRNTGELLDSLEKSQQVLGEEKIRLEEKLALMEEKKEELQEPLTKKMSLRAEQEQYLVSLKEEKEYYQEHLSNLEQAWNEGKELFSEIMREFTSIMKESSIPLEALNLSFDFRVIKGSIHEEILNAIVRENVRLPEMTFRFYSDKVQIEIPDQKLILRGIFSIQEGNILKLEVEEGSFYDMPLGTAAIEELFKDGYLLLNLKPVVGSNAIESVEIRDGYIGFEIKPVFN